MDEYIKRQDVIDAMKRLPHEYKTKVQRARAGGIADCQMAVRGLPPANVQPVVRGHFGKYTSPFTAPCSECGTSMNTHWNYCPICGAGMI